MSIKLTDTQLIILSAAAQREDRCLDDAQEPERQLGAKGLIEAVGRRTCQGDPGEAGSARLAA